MLALLGRGALEGKGLGAALGGRSLAGGSLDGRSLAGGSLDGAGIAGGSLDRRGHAGRGFCWAKKLFGVLPHVGGFTH